MKLQVYNKIVRWMPFNNPVLLTDVAEMFDDILNEPEPEEVKVEASALTESSEPLKLKHCVSLDSGSKIQDQIHMPTVAEQFRRSEKYT